MTTRDNAPGSPHEVRVAEAAELKAIGKMLGDAFQDDPIWEWVAQDERRRQKHLGSMFTEVIRSRVTNGLSWTIDGFKGAAVWAEPSKWEMTPIEMARSAVPTLRTIGLSSVRRGAKALQKIESLHPREPHWYLEFLASRADLRGHGVGSALMKPMMERCDFEAMPAYLESSKRENLPFYDRFGFEVTEEFTFGDGSPPMWGMWREPR